MSGSGDIVEVRVRGAGLKPAGPSCKSFLSRNPKGGLIQIKRNAVRWPNFYGCNWAAIRGANAVVESFPGSVMANQVLLPSGWSPPIGYSNGIAAPAGRIVFVAGQVGWDEQQVFHSEDIVPQFEQEIGRAHV